MSVANVPMRFILGLPVPTPLGKRLMLAYIVGRISGNVYRQPVSYVKDGSSLLTPGGGKWTRNVCDGQPVRIRLRGHDISVVPEVITGLDDVDRLLSVIMSANPSARFFVRIARDSEGKLDRSRLEHALRYGFCIVRWNLGQS